MDYKCKSLSENIFGSAQLKTGYKAETGTLFPFRLINFSWPIIGNLLWQCLLAQEFQLTLKASIEADSRWKNIAYKAYFIQPYFASLTWFGVLVIHQFHSHPTDFGRCKDIIMIIMLIQKSVRERRIPSSKELVHLLERIFWKRRSLRPDQFQKIKPGRLKSPHFSCLGLRFTYNICTKIKNTGHRFYS